MAATGDAAHPLRSASRPEFEVGDRPVRIADLFCGCGGLTLGVAQGAISNGRSLEVALALDSDVEAMRVYETNFPKATTSNVDIESVFDGELGAADTYREKRVAKEVGTI